MSSADLLITDHLKSQLTVKAMNRFKKVESLSEHYTVGEALSKGSFGTVYKGEHVQTGTVTAIKIVQKEKVQEREVHAELMKNELLVLETVNHPNIMRVFELMEDDNNYYIISEFISGGNLLDKLKEVGQLNEQQTAVIIRQVLMAVNYMHQTKKITHRDIKLENILCMPQQNPEDDLVVKLTDFGFASHYRHNEQFNLPLGTPHYMSPEIICEEDYDHRCDTWSIGILTFILLCGTPPFNSESNDRDELD